jgi:hypothetical protein
MKRMVFFFFGAVSAVALLAAGYAGSGLAGLADMAAIVAVAGLLLGRVMVRVGGKPPDVMKKEKVSGADFPGYAKIATDLEWAVLSRRHYELVLRPRFARLAEALPWRPVPDLGGPPDADGEGPGPDLATLARIVAQLEEH